MDDLISRSELMAAIKRQHCTDCDNYGGVRCRACHADDMMALVDDTPSVDAEPVRHGRWVKCQGKSNIWYCSECGEKINYKQNRRTYNIPKVPVWQKNKRCRNCGAKMDPT